MERLRRIGRDPLVHFLLAGAALFALDRWLHPPDSRSAEETTIVVDEAALITFLQYRSQAFEPAHFTAAYRALSPQQLRQLVDSYVREEAMVREARALGLEDADYVIRQRLIQKMLFLAEGASPVVPDPGEEELGAWFRAHADDYAEPERVTFTHVFIDDAIARPGGGQAEAERIMARLAARGAGFNDAPQYGDRFPYLLNFVGRSSAFVANQMGADFAVQLARLAPSPRWQGPLRSQFGWHVVLLTRRDPAGLPDFASLRPRLLGDYRAAKAADAREAAIRDLLEQYRVEIRLPEGALPPGTG